MKTLNKYSKTITQDETQPAAQAMLYGIGLSEEDMQKAQVGIVSTGYEGNTCNMHLNDLAKELKAGVQNENLVGLIFNTIGVSDGISNGTDGMRFSLVSRDVIADSIETVVSASWPCWRGGRYETLVEAAIAPAQRAAACIEERAGNGRLHDRAADPDNPVWTPQMRFRKETYVTMYAISTLKAPLAGSVQMLLGDKDRPTTSQKLNRLVEHGYLEKKPYGQQRVMYMLTLAGRAELQAFLSRNPAPTLHKRNEPYAQTLANVFSGNAWLLPPDRTLSGALI